MNTQAANKLLKILEEPWDKTLFLLLSASPEQLLPTIVSRTQCVTVPSIDETSLTRYLTARKGMPEADAFRAAGCRGATCSKRCAACGTRAKTTSCSTCS